MALQRNIWLQARARSHKPLPPRNTAQCAEHSSQSSSHPASSSSATPSRWRRRALSSGSDSATWGVPGCLLNRPWRQPRRIGRTPAFWATISYMADTAAAARARPANTRTRHAVRIPFRAGGPATCSWPSEARCDRSSRVAALGRKGTLCIWPGAGCAAYPGGRHWSQHRGGAWLRRTGLRTNLKTARTRNHLGPGLLLCKN